MQNQPNQISGGILAFGFASVLLLMILITVIGLSRMAIINKNLEDHLAEHNVKTELIIKLRNVTRERSVSLNAGSIMQEKFERDQELIRYQHLQTEYNRIRQQLMKLTLTEEQQSLLTQQVELSDSIEPVQQQVIDLILKEENARAQQEYLHKILPTENKVLEKIQSLLELERQISQNAMSKSIQTNHYAYIFMVILAVSGLGVGSAISFFVIRRVTRAEQELQESKEHVEVTLHSIGDAVITTDAEGYISYLNPVAERLTGWESVHALGEPLLRVFNIINELDRSPGNNPVEQCMITGGIVHLSDQTLLLSKSGDEFAIEDSAAPIRNSNGEIIGAVLVFHDVSLAKRMAQQLAWQASHDALTGLANRNEFEKRLARCLHSARTEKIQHALCFLDLDQFKVVNDTCGHIAGDELLRQLAHVFIQSVRNIDSVARLGGDEFAILMENCDLNTASVIAEQIRQNIAEFRFIWQDTTFDVGASIGLIALNEHSESLTQVLSTADAACYLAKDKGRNQIHIYQPGDQELAARHGEMQWVSKITKALEEDRLSIYAQSIVPVNTVDQGVFCEVTVYMLDENGNTIPPNQYLSAAERYALTPAIDRWVVKSTFKTISNYPQAKLYTCAINLSGHSFCDDDFLSFIIKQFDTHNIAPECICFEITETAAIANLSKAVRFITILREMGCRFALDDFGSGLSSFAYLKNLKVQYLKIDGSFIVDVVHDPIDKAMVEAINQIGHIMGLKTIAEYVESQKILDSVKSIGIDYAQGFELAKPEPLVDLLLRHQADTMRNPGQSQVTDPVNHKPV